MELMSKFRGFTLVELLITISIIAILAAIGIVVYSSALKSGRDAKRQSDLRAIQSALEQYFADQFSYPIYSSSCTNGTLAFGCAFTNPTGTKTYLNQVPTEAVSSNPQYCYFQIPGTCDPSTATKCTSYNLHANLENPPTGYSITSCRGSNYNLTVTPP